MYSRCLSLLCLLVAIAAGCSDPYAGQAEVTGHVRLGGQSLRAGSISFEPLDGQGTQSGAAITNGEYKVPRQHGLKPGRYRVRVTAGDGKTPAKSEAAGPGGSTNIVSRDLVPADWNTQSKQEVEVNAGGVNTFDFDIPAIDAPKAR
jgi:hypothetical protein